MSLRRAFFGRASLEASSSTEEQLDCWLDNPISQLVCWFTWCHSLTETCVKRSTIIDSARHPNLAAVNLNVSVRQIQTKLPLYHSKFERFLARWLKMISIRSDSVRLAFDACILRNVCFLKAGANSKAVFQTISACSGNKDLYRSSRSFDSRSCAELDSGLGRFWFVSVRIGLNLGFGVADCPTKFLRIAAMRNPALFLGWVDDDLQS